MRRTQEKLVGNQCKVNVIIHDATWIHMRFQESLLRTKVLRRRRSEAKLQRGDDEDDTFAWTSGRCKVCGDSRGSDNVEKE
eukprot:3913638-Karenia_brevis.AAC.1